MSFYPGFEIRAVLPSLDFEYGEDCFGPKSEKRKLDDIRPSLLDPDCKGPEVVYGIAMDVGKKIHREILKDRMLLFGVVTYAAGQLGNEPIRSQGHIHKVSNHSGWSPPEIYEIWSGRAIIYMQEYAEDNPGRCYAVFGEPGDVIIVPPDWAHATISADPSVPLTFGAWCDREYGFAYDKVRAHKGLAWYPLVSDKGSISWQWNQNYSLSRLVEKSPEDYRIAFDIEKNVPIYSQFEKNPERFQFVSEPFLKREAWINYTP